MALAPEQDLSLGVEEMGLDRTQEKVSLVNGASIQCFIVVTMPMHSD